MSSTTPNTPLTYDQAGVNYDVIDPLKIAAQRAAAETGAHLAVHGFTEVNASRGESAYVVDVGPMYLASIVECLGTKTLVADEMAALTGQSYYDGIAQDTIAMAVNDLITVGATPLVVQAYWAAGGSDWFNDTQRSQALVAGWKKACDTCQVAWGGGETPALAGIVADGRVDLAASCTGIISPKERLSVGDKLGAGDAIVFLASSGIHANGLSLARKLVEMHGGTLEAESAGSDQGAVFKVRLPRPQVTAMPATGPISTTDPSITASSPEHRLRLLVVDDNVDAAETLTMLLQLAGHDTRTAHDGPAAITLAADWTPHAVFLDIGMPGMSGYEVLRQLRRRPALDGVTFVALTGWGSEEDRRLAHDAGFDFHLTKPADLDRVGDILSTLASHAP